jgi:hypothetical protein
VATTLSSISLQTPRVQAHHCHRLAFSLQTLLHTWIMGYNRISVQTQHRSKARIKFNHIGNNLVPVACQAQARQVCPPILNLFFVQLSWILGPRICVLYALYVHKPQSALLYQLQSTTTFLSSHTRPLSCPTRPTCSLPILTKIKRAHKVHKRINKNRHT